MLPKSEEIVGTVERVCAVLQALPLDDLPRIGGLELHGSEERPPRVALRLGDQFDNPAPALLVWAAALPDPSAGASWGRDFLQLGVASNLAGASVVVWAPIAGALMPHAAAILHLTVAIGTPVVVPVELDALRELAAGAEPRP